MLLDLYSEWEVATPVIGFCAVQDSEFLILPNSPYLNTNPATYLIGNLIRLYAAFSSIAGIPTDPNDVILNVRDGAGTVTPYNYSGGALIRDSAGYYHFDYEPAENGIFYYNYSGTGACIASAERKFIVAPSAVL